VVCFTFTLGFEVGSVITKTDALNAHICPRLAWLARRRPEAAQTNSADERARIEGIAVGLRARGEFPQGELMGPSEPLPTQSLTTRDVVSRDVVSRDAATRDAATRAESSESPALFELEFVHDDLLARVDVLERSEAGWRLIEVKANSADPGPEPLGRKTQRRDFDLAFQRIVVEAAGLPLAGVELMMLNREHRHPGPEPLFIRFDRRAATRALRDDVMAAIAIARDVIDAPQEPATALGPQCRQHGIPCAFTQHCRRAAGLDAPGSVIELYRGGRAVYQAIAEGKTLLSELDSTDLGEIQRRQIEVARSGEAFVDRPALQAALDDLQFPLVHLDFEAINHGLPRHEGMAPWEFLPFQFSAHVEKSVDASPEHFEFLARDLERPHVELAAALAALLVRWPEGSIIVWYEKFEKSQLALLARHFPDFADVFLAARERIVDALPLTRDHVYLPAFRGSFSLKYVAPAILGLAGSYTELEVADGGAAMLAWDELTRTRSDDRSEEIRRDLLRYCEQDTLVMVEILRALRKL
jgi:CRISPR/Cas system-associated exonuclease Cas4 (RecB family)